ncbi:nucleotidyltransferase family protein [Thioalkalivibrio sp.]|uniref:nucleotidyltransferase family protein n=1 Tax=Thioalkalivibrio sp. TaxID=2093813 RepID=UPI003974FE9C
MSAHRNTDLQNRIRTVVEQFRPRVAFSCLFGSVARGEDGSLSDIDLGVHFTEEVALAALSRLSGATRRCSAVTSWA